MAEPPEAREVTLKKLRPLAPPFHRHIARAKMLGRPCRVGDRIVVYEVVRTVPEGMVQVTDSTALHFE
jgi:hypothetical protein